MSNKKEERLKQILDFDSIMKNHDDNEPLWECEYVSIKGKVISAKALFHKVALVLRINEN